MYVPTSDNAFYVESDRRLFFVDNYMILSQ